MGIKKRLEQIGNQSEQPGRLADVVVEKPIKKYSDLEFDVKIEVGEEGWEKMKKKYEEKCEQDDYWDIAEAAAHLKILFPNKTSELDLKNKWEKMKKDYENKYEDDDLHDALLEAMFLKILFPNKVGELNLEDKWKQAKEYYEYCCETEDWSITIDFAACLKTLFPNKVGELKLEDKWKKMKEKYEEKYKFSQGSYWDMAETAVYLKILFPNKVDELELEDKWEGMKKEYKNFMNTGWKESYLIPARLKILAAEEIKITDQGVELIMKNEEDFEEGVSGRPERLST